MGQCLGRELGARSHGHGLVAHRAPGLRGRTQQQSGREAQRQRSAWQISK